MDQDRNKGDFEKVGEVLGEVAGKAAGRATDIAMNAAGAAMNVAGSAFGTMMQSMGDWWSTPQAERASRSFDEQADRVSQEHFESRTRSGGAHTTEYASARPYYQFGHLAGQNPDYQGKAFDEVEADLQRAWERAAQEGFGDWSEARESVSFGYSTGRSRPAGP